MKLPQNHFLKKIAAETQTSEIAELHNIKCRKRIRYFLKREKGTVEQCAGPFYVFLT
jgi:hypothetical protein